MPPEELDLSTGASHDHFPTLSLLRDFQAGDVKDYPHDLEK
ncbi:hypothetical protein PABG_12408 [Paracoccidioides brasiliensis Pb03]|uniref:Uncharacterized protein n=1 Tax=Paracoccidioides brasiliensis TaxID=121759 RepID=A0A1D2JJR9_PARBR|nr:hypothetical protein PABG_12408 [Paracoccidioides brasiliensis Pb03]ODH39046.1 hypothetical protein ACO22_02054 [Paracoccidioides brasiliensis]